MPKSVHHAGPKVLHHDVGRLRQPAEDRLSLWPLDIESEGAFVAIRGEKEGADTREEGRSGRTTILTDARLLDLDDVGAEIAQQHGAGRTCEVTSQIEHAHPGQWHLGGPRPVGHRIVFFPISCLSWRSFDYTKMPRLRQPAQHLAVGHTLGQLAAGAGPRRRQSAMRERRG